MEIAILSLVNSQNIYPIACVLISAHVCFFLVYQCGICFCFPFSESHSILGFL